MANGMNGNFDDMKGSAIERDSKTFANDIEADYEPLFDVEEDDDFGRYLVASENISQGQLILLEKPTGNFCFDPEHLVLC